MKKTILYFIFLLVATAGFSQVFENETKADVDHWSKQEQATRQRIRDNKIHSVKTFIYRYDTTAASGKKYLATEMLYDDQGNLTEFKSYKKNVLKYHYTYKWDDQGRNLEFVNLRRNGSTRFREVNSYDASGNKTDERTYGKTWLLSNKETLWWRSEATFDERQNMKEQKFYFDSAGRKLFDRYEYSFYPDGSKKQTIEYSGKNKVRHIWNYDCNPAGIPEGQNLKDTSTICIRYETDKDGNKIKVKDENVKYGKVARMVRKYDKNDNVLEEINYDSKGRMIFHSTSAYNDKNKFVAHTVYQRNSDKIKSRSEYHYDSAGNITEQIAWKTASVPHVIVKYSYQ